MRLLVLGFVAVILGQSCAPGFDPASKIQTLRILSVSADKPYGIAGEEITLRMTVYDALGDAAGAPRELQVVWIAGCFDPEGDQYFLCFEQLAEVLAPLGSGGLPPAGLVDVDMVPANVNGVPDALEFSFTLPEDIVTRRPAPDEGPHYGIAYVFFAACAGQLSPAELVVMGDTVPEFPVRCLDEAGNPQGPESFVPGYTQVYAFADERQNDNPPVLGITLDGALLPDAIDTAPTVARCPVSAQDRRTVGCGSEAATDACTKYMLQAVVEDVAEVDPDALNPDGAPFRETVWVSYFSDGGDFDPSLALVSDASLGFQPDHDTEWTPPDEPGLYQIWAVLRDQRGGSSTVRRYVNVQ